MITQTSKKPEIHIKKGQIIKGKWHRHRYHIVKKLGNGAIGSVYLCVNGNKQVALKLSKQSASISSEVNVLKAFQAVQGYHLGPSLIDVDDYEATNGFQYSFYVMEYISGDTLHDFIRQNGHEWLVSLLIGFAKDLQVLHKEGYVFGDLKIENLIVSRKPAKLKWVDVGGTTLQGRAIKEYTEFYDRAYWQCGSRKADPGYDLFALAMVIVRIYYPNGFSRGNNPKKTLQLKINQAVDVDPLRRLLLMLIHGSIKDAEQVKDFLLTYFIHQKNKRDQRSASHKRSKKQDSVYPLLEVGSILTIGGVCYLYVTLFM
ncbi:serine/threonine protein kinase [Gracilibacillus kekensis]|uniref:Serine/threonine protein kinase n=1 Tax=Gracilibacillus kekensis TaxID=1027249 RepID=A0A1M7QYU1_9BACI|nr:protein kinase [Gracilibacillus kekensis]SHN37426.1 serine/threonine protein kinase [Gracilibacillus kekensis]